MTQCFDLVDMRLFMNIAETGNLTKGAERLLMSAPGASTRIKNLEEAVGTKLLERGSRGVSLTGAGHVYLNHARLIIEEIETLRHELTGFSSGVKGQLRLTATTTVVSELLQPVLRRFLSDHPDVTIDLRDQSSSEVVESVRECRADVGIAVDSGRLHGVDLIPYKRDDLLLTVPFGHPLSTRSSVRFEESLEYSFVGFHEKSAIQKFIQSRAQEIGHKIRCRIHVSDFESVFKMVEAGIGVGIFPACVVRRYQPITNVKCVSLDETWAFRELKVCVRRQAKLPNYVADLIEALRSDT